MELDDANLCGPIHIGLLSDGQPKFALCIWTGISGALPLFVLTFRSASMQKFCLAGQLRRVIAW